MNQQHIYKYLGHIHINGRNYSETDEASQSKTMKLQIECSNMKTHKLRSFD